VYSDRWGNGRPLQRKVRGGLTIVASGKQLFGRLALLACLACALSTAARGDGLSGYLPLNLEPEVERQIERVLILADEPILKRPFPVALVRAALPEACRQDAPLCKRVERYLDRYEQPYALTHASVTGSLHSGADVVLANQHGLTNDSSWEASAQGYFRPSDYLLVSAGGIGYAGRTVPTGSMLSFGNSWAQLDVGWRDHWLSPMTDTGSMLMSTEAPTMLSATLSNWEPMTRLGFQYEFFLGRLTQTGSDVGESLTGDNIVYDGVASRGNPRVLGMQLSIEPFPGWSLGVNRLLEYGGGSSLPDSESFLLRDLFKPSGLSQTQGNQQASYVSRFVFPGKTPFAVYFQYAGEDNSDGGSYLLGNAALSAGIDFPRLWRHFDLTYEISEWQNIWYVHNIFLDGMTSYGLVLGNWGADQRNFGDGVGARGQMLRIGWEPPFGGYLELRAHSLVNQTYYGGDVRQYSVGEPLPYPYFHYYDVGLTYSHPWEGLTLGGEALVGRDVYGGSFTRLSGFLRYGGSQHSQNDTAGDDDAEETSYGGLPGQRNSELFVDAGVNMNKVREDLATNLPTTYTPTGFGPHFGLGARRAVSDNNDLGVRLELDEVQDHSLIGVRAIDWRYRFDTVAFGLFAGVDRYNLATPAYSLYGGAGLLFRDFFGSWLPRWNLGLDLRYGQNIARDHVLPTDPTGLRPDSFYKIESCVLYLSRSF
ncbi:MAG: capsule assembly Wzi family protein, partial [Steroidobacteraceae bacterium]